MVYVWTHGAEKSIKMAPDMKLSQYDLVGLSAGNTTAMSAGKTPLTSGASHSQFILCEPANINVSIRQHTVFVIEKSQWCLGLKI